MISHHNSVSPRAAENTCYFGRFGWGTGEILDIYFKRTGK